MVKTRDDDDENPFYCPSLPATSFLQNIRQQHLGGSPELYAFREDQERAFPSFSELLDKSVTVDDLLELAYRPVLSDGSDNSGSIDSPLLTPDRNLQEPPVEDVQEDQPDFFSELRGPSKRERSIASVNDASFELSGKAERLVYFPRRDASPYSIPRPSFGGSHRVKTRGTTSQTDGDLHERIKTLEAELYGVPVGTESPRGMKTLLDRLDKMVPGIRLKQRLSGLYGHQEIIDVMCSEGCITSRVLNVFRTSEIDSLDLASTLADENDLNLGARDLLQVLAKPNSFVFLSEVNFTGAPLRDIDIACLHNLPRLSRLWLNSTGISNEAIFLLTPLKRTLTDLDVADNLDIDDDAVPVFKILTKLEFLAFSGTSISMVGVRRLAKIVEERNRPMEVEITQAGEEYLRKLEHKYLVDPGPSLSTDPGAVQNLTANDVLQNLVAHGMVNPAIGARSTDYFLAQQLKELLETRKADLCARKLLWQE